VSHREVPRLCTRTKRELCWRRSGCLVVTGSSSASANSPRFQRLHRLFLKSADRVDGEAQIAIVKSDATGCEELTMGGLITTRSPRRPNGNRFLFRAFQKDGSGFRIMNLDTKAVTTLTSEYHNFPLWSPRRDLIMFSCLVDGSYEVWMSTSQGRPPMAVP
jgi:hypothetical protein